MPRLSHANHTYLVIGLTNVNPSTHVDITPTILTWTGLPKDQWPVFLDGRDLSPDWTHPVGRTVGAEVINIEFWGDAGIEGGLNVDNLTGNSYKTLRIIGSNYGYLYSQWCTNEIDYYDTVVSFSSLSIIIRMTGFRTTRTSSLESRLQLNQPLLTV